MRCGWRSVESVDQLAAFIFHLGLSKQLPEDILCALRNEVSGVFHIDGHHSRCHKADELQRKCRTEKVLSVFLPFNLNERPEHKPNVSKSSFAKCAQCTVFGGLLGRDILYFSSGQPPPWALLDVDHRNIHVRMITFLPAF